MATLSIDCIESSVIEKLVILEYSMNIIPIITKPIIINILPLVLLSVISYQKFLQTLIYAY